MADWTEAAVREALACVDGAEWRIDTTGPHPVTAWCGTGREEAGLCVTISEAYVDAEFFPGGFDDPQATAGVGVEDAPRMTAEHVRAAVTALRACVIATHGPEAWPWAMREGGSGVEFDEHAGEWLRKEVAP